MTPRIYSNPVAYWPAPETHYRVQLPVVHWESHPAALYAGDNYIGMLWPDYSFGFRGQIYYIS